MANILLGPAGIPKVSKGSSTVEGIKTVAALGLNSMEVEFVRGVHMSLESAKEVGEAAKEHNIELSVHAPYYVNLLSEDKRIVNESKERIFVSAERAEKMNAKIVVIHAAYYGELMVEQAIRDLKERFSEILDKMKEHGIKNVKLGVETSGRVKQFGSLDEIIRLCKLVNCVPVVDFAHIFARQAGRIDYGEIFDKLEALNIKHLHTHFSGIKWTPVKIEAGNEKHHLPIQSNQPPFESLAKEILKRKLNITIISESPVLEQDSLVMKRIFERLGYEF